MRPRSVVAAAAPSSTSPSWRCYHRAELQGEYTESGRRLHYKYVYQILAGCLAKIKTQPTVVHVSTVVSQNITVIGDLHGARRNRRARARARPASSPR